MRTITTKTKVYKFDIFRDLAKWLYKRLESNYDYLTSDKAIIETIKSNEREFLIDGTPH